MSSCIIFLDGHVHGTIDDVFGNGVHIACGLYSGIITHFQFFIVFGQPQDPFGRENGVLVSPMGTHVLSGDEIVSLSRIVQDGLQSGRRAKESSKESWPIFRQAHGSNGLAQVRVHILYC